MNVFQRSQDAFATLCTLYGDAFAQDLMKIRGACDPDVARLARAMGKSRASIVAAINYRTLTCLRGGYQRLMSACHQDGAVKRVVDAARKNGKNFKPWQIDVAVQVLLTAVDKSNGVV